MIKKDKPLMYDPLIINRVKQYLEDNVHQTYVDVAIMAQDLQDKYKEYNKRKAGPFRQLVEQAYKTVLHSYGLDSNPSSDDDGDVNSDLEVMEDNAAKPDPMNDALQSLYMNNKGNKRAPATAVTQGESINISSDESGDENVAKKHPILAKVTPDIIVTKIQKPAEPPKTPTKPVADVEPAAKKRKVESPAVEPKEQPPVTEKTPEKVPEVEKKIDEKPEVQPEPQPEVPEVTQVQKRKGKKDSKFSTVTFENFGGNEKILKDICEVLLYYKRPKVCRHIGLTPPKGLLLHGPPGSGKTLLAHAIAGQLNVPIMEVAAPEFVTGISGDSEARIRRMFEQVVGMAPCVLFIDEIDVISSHRNNAQKDMERRIVAQLIISMDNLGKVPNGDQVLVIGATSRVEALDPSLRRGGRFDMEVCLGIPDRESRADILRVICEKMTLERPFDFDALAALTPGYVGVDLVTLTITAARVAFMKVILAKEGKAFLQKYSKTQENTTVPIVNLDEDPILMDTTEDEQKVPEAPEEAPQIIIDDDEQPKEAEKPVEVIKENGNGVLESPEKIVGKDEPMEIDATEITQKDQVQNIAEVPQEKKDEALEEKKNDTLAEKKDETQEEKKDDEPKVIENVIQNVDKVEEVKDKLNDCVKDIENGDVTIVSEEAATIDITESPKKAPPAPQVEEIKEQQVEVKEQEVVVKEPEVEVKETVVEMKEPEVQVKEAVVEMAEPEKEEEVKVPEQEIKEPEEEVHKPIESLAENLLKDPKFRLQLSLNEMLNLLSTDTAITPDDLRDFSISMEDFREALKTTQPVAKREGFITVPNVTWQDIGSLWDIREELKLAVTSSVKYPKKLKALKLEPSCGVLLCGPPGCGKTLLAKAVANEAGINFISVKGPELLNMYVGESERAVRQCFQRARYSAPCVIFFDEFDALCPKRSSRTENTGAARVVNQLLTEMDGMEDRKGVFVLAATNRPDMIDSAVLRPGRFDKILFVGIPMKNDRCDILKALTKNGTEPHLANDVDLDDLAELTDGYTGADLAGLVRQASVKAFKESLRLASSDDSDDIRVTKDNFLDALLETKPSVSVEERENYEKLRIQYSSHLG